MDKSSIKNFATCARRSLIDQVMQKAYEIGILKDKILNTEKVHGGFIYNGVTYGDKELKQRKKLEDMRNLRSDGKGYEYGYNQVVEEVSYTWFNRFIALRFMEVNNYLPSGVRILSSVNENKMEPDAISEVYSLEYVDSNLVDSLMKDTEKLYKYILISQCNELSNIMPKMFQKISDYTEILLPDKLYTKGGIVYDLVHDISEEDFKEQVEIIGWLYQYYISEKKDEVFAGLKKNVKISKENIPAATQLFTPDWIVKYMVENSLGRLWIENTGDNTIKGNFKYYLDEAEQETEVKSQLDEIRNKNIKPEEIKVIDPCMGSGHILVYAFDVLYLIYESLGYSQRDIPRLILENNIYGLDIDERAGQLAYFALMMKARSYNRRFFRDANEIKVNVYSFFESDDINKEHIKFMGNNIEDKKEWEKLYDDVIYIVDLFMDAKEYGSILKFYREIDVGKLKEFVGSDSSEDQVSFETVGIEETRFELIGIFQIVDLLTRKYDVVVTNPPYMGGSGMNILLSNYLKKNYPDTKSDLFASFIEICGEMTKKSGHIGLITPYVWMFISSYEKMRKKLLLNQTISSLIQLEYNAFEVACVPVCTFTLRNYKTNILGHYIKLSDFRGIENQEPKTIEAIKNPLCGYRFSSNQENFAKIPGMPVAYWVSEKVFNLFKQGILLGDIAYPRQGLATADNGRFLRLWFEIPIKKIGINFTDRIQAFNSYKKWFPFNKGGSFRKWIGNYDYVINWFNDGKELFNNKASVIRNPNYYFKDGISYSDVTSGNFSMRLYNQGFIFDSTGPTCFNNNKIYLLGFMNTVVAGNILKILCPTIHFTQNSVAKVPIIFSEEHHQKINDVVNKNIIISKTDWDAFETSWDFIRHPLTIIYEAPIENDEIAPNWTSACIKPTTIEDEFNFWNLFTTQQFSLLKSNEEELNRIFIEIYGLEDELTPEVLDKDVTIRKADLTRDIKSLISYSVGCMFGRYSLDSNGLVFAGGDFDINKYKSFIPAKENIIPITDEEYFDDDIVVRFVEFIKKAFGEETLEENLEFIAKSIYPNSTTTSRQAIRKYFLTDFYKDHLKVYQKKPIYWQFDSGKQNGFKALVYLHRYDRYTVARVRTDYLHNLQRMYEAEIKRMDMISNLGETSAKEKASYKKSIDLLEKKVDELKRYDQAIAHIANKSLELDLDDGVTVNYAKFQNIDIIQSDGKGNLKIDLLSKI